MSQPAAKEITWVKAERAFQFALNRTQHVHYKFAMNISVALGMQVDTAFPSGRKILFPFSTQDTHLHAPVALILLPFLSWASACLLSLCHSADSQDSEHIQWIESRDRLAFFPFAAMIWLFWCFRCNLGGKKMTFEENKKSFAGNYSSVCRLLTQAITVNLLLAQ